MSVSELGFEARRRRGAFVDLSFTADEAHFRRELRSYLESTLPAEWSQPGFWDSLDPHEAFALRRQWEAEKAKAGFTGIAWPKEWGGRGGTEGMKAIYDEERARAPGAGADLAAIRTSGVLDGDEYVVNGQKIWTTQAIHGDKLFALIRTEPGSTTHQGLSLMLLDMHQPGVEA